MPHFWQEMPQFHILPGCPVKTFIWTFSKLTQECRICEKMRETLIKLRIQIEILVELGTNRDSDDGIQMYSGQ